MPQQDYFESQCHFRKLSSCYIDNNAYATEKKILPRKLWINILELILILEIILVYLIYNTQWNLSKTIISMRI